MGGNFSENSSVLDGVGFPIKEQDWLPGEGNGGMEQLGSAGKVSMLVAFPSPPVIIRPVLKDCTKHKQIVPVFVFELIAVLLEKKPQFLWEF